MKRHSSVFALLLLATATAASSEVSHDSGPKDVAVEKEASHLNDVGADLLSKGKVEQAIELFTKAIRHNPNSAFAFYNRGTAYALRVQLEPAIADYSEAIRIDPDFAYAFMNRGVAYSMQGRFGDALGDLNKAIDLKPSKVDPYYNRALVFTKLGQLVEAAKDYTTEIGRAHV